MAGNIKKSLIFFLLITLSILLYFLSRRNYLLFHSIVETYSIIIAGGIFFVSWNSRDHSEHDNFNLLGISYLFVGSIDFFHIMSYTGMNIFTDYSFYANQLWICARLIESLSLLAFVILGFKKVRIPFNYIFAIYFTVTSLCFLSIFIWKIFPECFIEGEGQTPFKITSEYIICIILALTLFLIIKTRNLYDRTLFKQIAWSIVFTIISEFSFTLYTDNFGIINVIGHFFKALSFYLIYRAIIVNTLKRPFEILFTELSETKAILQAALDQSTAGIAIADAAKNKLRYINNAGLQILGIKNTENDPQGAVEKSADTLEIFTHNGRPFDSSDTPLTTAVVRAVLSKESTGREFIIRKEGLPEKIVLANSTPVKNSRDEITAGILIFQDITERKLDEKRILELLNEKNLILKEVHHRIKNNMNTICSLLTLQADAHDDNNIKDILFDAASRVESMGILYDRLYRSDNDNSLSLREYLPELTKKMISLFSTSRPIKINTQIDDIVMPAKTLTPLGIIINELITNSMKYAFKGDENGVINLSALKTGNNVTITYSDSGKGIPETINFENSPGFGMQLVGLLVRHINGSISISREQGTKIIIELPF